MMILNNSRGGLQLWWLFLCLIMLLSWSPSADAEFLLLVLYCTSYNNWMLLLSLSQLLVLLLSQQLVLYICCFADCAVVLLYTISYDAAIQAAIAAFSALTTFLAFSAALLALSAVHFYLAAALFALTAAFLSLAAALKIWQLYF